MGCTVSSSCKNNSFKWKRTFREIKRLSLLFFSSCIKKSTRHSIGKTQSCDTLILGFSKVVSMHLFLKLYHFKHSTGSMLPIFFTENRFQVCIYCTMYNWCFSKCRSPDTKSLGTDVSTGPEDDINSITTKTVDQTDKLFMRKRVMALNKWSRRSERAPVKFFLASNIIVVNDVSVTDRRMVCYSDKLKYFRLKKIAPQTHLH